MDANQLIFALFKQKIIHLSATSLLNKYSFFLSPSDSLQRCSTTLGGEMPVTTSSLYLLQSSLSLAWSSSPSGTHTCFKQLFYYNIQLDVIQVVLNPHYLYCRIIYCTWVYPVTIYEPFFGYYFFNGLLMVLQCLHIFWAVLIIRIAVRFLTNNVSKQRSSRVCLFIHEIMEISALASLSSSTD